MLFTVALLIPADGESRGRKPADVYKGKIILSTKAFPQNFKNDRAFIKYVKKAHTNEFWPEKDGGSWRFNYMAFFGRPLERRGYSVLFYDITDPNRPKFIIEARSFPSSDGQRIMAGKYTLNPLNFEPNKKYLMTYSLGQGQAALAETVFVLRGFDPKRAERLKAERDAENRAAEAAAKKKAEEREKKKELKWQPPNW